ncbi:MAG: hypothetical protein JXB32_17225 [Deltaproteobacteria bacterium]|nr:hypothetical protein [Deltaproteobacteria bacterium]
MDQIAQMMELVSTKLAELARSDLVVGDPIELGPVTVVPLTQVGVGIGGGGGEGEGAMAHHGAKRPGGAPPFEHGKGTGGGAGGGAKIRPVAVIIFAPDGVRVEPIPDRKGVLDKLMDYIPELIERVHKTGAPPPSETKH